MKLLLCPKCGEIPAIETVERVIGTLYRLHCCGMIAFGDPIVKPVTPGLRGADEREWALRSAYTRWNEAVKEMLKWEK